MHFSKIYRRERFIGMEKYYDQIINFIVTYQLKNNFQVDQNKFMYLHQYFI